MFSSIRARLIASFIGASFVVGAVSLYVLVQLLNRAMLSEAKNRASLDLNAAHEICQNRIKQGEVSLNITTLGYGIIKALKDGDTSDLIFRLGRMSHYASLDFSRQAKPDRELVDVNKLVGSTTAMKEKWQNRFSTGMKFDIREKQSPQRASFDSSPRFLAFQQRSPVGCHPSIGDNPPPRRIR
jgi:hypothetical protein